MLKDLQCNGFNLYPEDDGGIADRDHSQIVSKVTVIPGQKNLYDREANLQGLVTLGKAYEKQLVNRLPHAAVDEVTEIFETLAIVRGQIHRTQQQLAEVGHAS